MQRNRKFSDITEFVVTTPQFLAQSASMTTEDFKLMPALGFLRSALLGLALLNIILPLLGLLFPPTETGNGHDLWSVLTTVIAPVMSPLLATVILFDYIMSRIRAADADEKTRGLYTTIARIELTVIGISLLFWVPYFVLLLS